MLREGDSCKKELLQFVLSGRTAHASSPELGVLPHATVGCSAGCAEPIRLGIYLTDENRNHGVLRQTTALLLDSFLNCVCGSGRFNAKVAMNKSVPLDHHVPERIAAILVRSQHAALVSKELSTRINYLLEIASPHTGSEPLDQPGLGRSGMRRVEKWMKFHGRRFAATKRVWTA